MDEVAKLAIIIGVIVFSVVLHEMAHGLMAYFLGDRTARDMGRLSFNPVRHIDPYMSILVPVILYMVGAPVFGGAKPVPINTRNLKFREWGMALVAMAGPFTNFLLAFLGFLIGHFSGIIYENSLSGFFFYRLVIANLGFMIFNLLPIPPLDGSRVLYALSPDGVRNLLVTIESYGVFLVYILIWGFGQAFSEVMTGGILGMLKFFYWIVGA